MHSAPHLRPHRGLSSRRGVSLLWVLVALCGIALVAIVAIPAYFSNHEVTLDAACRLLARDLRSVQTHCAYNKVAARFLFDADGWSALDSSGRSISALGEVEPVQRRFSRDAVFEGVHVRDFALGPDQVLSIDARGLLTENGELVLFFGQDQRRVVIERGAGNVLIYKPGTDEPTEARLLPSEAGAR